MDGTTIPAPGSSGWMDDAWLINQIALGWYHEITQPTPPPAAVVQTPFGSAAASPTAVLAMAGIAVILLVLLLR